MSLFQDLYNKAKTALTDDKGFFRQGKFTPVTQLTGKSLQQQMNPPMLSPLASNAPNRPTTWNTPETYEQEQPTIIAPPKPSFKTQAAEKLNSRLDQIKRFGSSVVAKSMDNEGIVRQGQFKPFAPLDDKINEIPAVKVVKRAVEKRVDGVKQFGTGLGKSITTRMDVNKIMEDQKAEIERNNQNFAKVKQLRAEGKNDEAAWLLDKMVKNTSDIENRLNNLDQEISKGKKDLISGSVKTAEIPLSLYAGAPKIIANSTIGSILGGGISKFSGETPEQQIEAAATGMDDAFGYTGITSLITNPLIEKILSKSQIKNILLNQLTQRGIGGLGNIGEDALLAKLDGQDYGAGDAVTSAIIGAAITGNDGIAKGGKKLIDKYVFGKTPEIQQATKKKIGEFFGNQYVKVSKAYNGGIDKLTKSASGGYLPEIKDVPDGKGGFKRIAIDPTTGKPKIYADNSQYNQMAGGVAGIETYQDENGETKVRFNPEKAAMGIGVMAGVKTKAGREAISKLKLPELKVPDVKVPDVKVPEIKPKTELDWAIENNKKPETTKSIADIFSNRKTEIGTPNPISVKGNAIDVDQLVKEGWDLNQIDYAVKQANNAKVNPDDGGAYVRGILKKQYPSQASKMGNKPSQSDINQNAIPDMENKFKQLEKAGYNPNPEIKVEPPKVEQPKPKTIKDVLTKSELEKQTQAKKAELDYADIKRTEITDMMKKEGFDTSTETAEKIMSGEIKASPELKSAIEKHSKALGGEVVKYKGLPEDKLKENYVPHVKKDIVTDVDTSADGFVGMMNRNTFNPTKKRTGSLKTEDMADVSSAFRQEHISVLNSKYYDTDQANKLIAEHNIPKEKGDEVLNFVKQEREQADKIVTDHIDKTDFGVKHDYLTDAKTHDDKLAEITGTKVERPVVPVTHSNWIVNSVDNLQSLIRGDAMFFKDKTNKEINDAFLDFRLSQTGETKKQYGVELNKFINKLTKYDYADPAVRERVNMFIDDKLKENKVIQGLGDKALRGATEVFSMAQIGMNVKTVIAQPTETFRIIPEHGIKSFLKGVTNAFSPTEAKRLTTQYGLEKEISGNLAQNPIFKEINDDPAFKDKVYDSFKKFLFKGLEVTENWKNIAYASALEDAGKKKGLTGEPLKKFVMQDMLRLAHMADTDMTPRIMKNNALGGSLLQYSQYLLKNEVLKWDTITSKDLKASEKMKKVTGLFLSDLAAIGTISAVTGVNPDGIKGWLSNSGLPSNLGPILTVPWQMGKEALAFSKLTPEEQEKETSLMDKEKAIILRNFIPMGNQISKTKGALKVMDKGYAESKKGNVNYAVGDMNPIQKAQATIFGQGAIPAKKEADKKWDNLKKDGIYPTLTAEQSATLKDLPKDEQKAYYDSKMENQKSAKDIIKDEEKKPNLISSIFGKKETKEKQSISGILTSETATNQEKAKAKSIIKEKLDSGNTESINDDDLKTYFFNEVDKLPESSASEKQAKTIAKFKKLDSIYDSETLDQDTKDKLIKLSGISKEDVTYYNNAKDDATVKAIRQEELAGTIDRKSWLSQLEDGRKLVGNKQIVDNATLNELYERGLLSDAERDYLVAVKYDPASSSFYLDRDYKDKSGAASAAQAKKNATALKTLKDKLKTGVDKVDNSSIKSINSYLNNKSKPTSNTSKTIGSILSGQKMKKIVTQPSTSSATVKRVKSKYRFSK